jgi:hypothetical protein
MIPSRPLNLSGILDESIRIIKHTYWRSAVLLVLFALPGFIVMQIGVDKVLDGGEEYMHKFTQVSPEAPRLLRDFIFVNQGNDNSFALVRLQNPGLFHVIDSIHTSLQTQYPDSASKAALSSRLDSISDIVSGQNKLSGFDMVFSQIGVGLIILVAGGFIFILGYIGAIGAQYDLSSRVFEERSLGFGPIFRLSLSRSLWFLIVQYFIIAFSMLFGLGLVVSISFAISPILGAFGFLVSFIFFFYSAIRLIFSPVALVSEELGPLEAIKRSLELTKGSFWRICGLLILALIMYYTARVMISLPLTFALSSQFDWLVDFIRGNNQNMTVLFNGIRSDIRSLEISSIVVSLIVASFGPAFLTTFYYDLRTRNDGVLEYDEESDHETI